MWRRFSLDLAVIAVLGVAAVVVGRAFGAELGWWLARQTGLEQIVIRDPSDLAFAGLGTVFVLPAVFAGLAGIAVRVRRHAAPSPVVLVAVAASVAAMIAIWLALRVHWFAGMPVEDNGIKPMISLDSFEFPQAAWQAGVVTGVVGLLLSARRPRTPAPSSAARTP